MTPAARTRDNRGLTAERQGMLFCILPLIVACCRCLRRGNAHQHMAVEKTHHLTRKVRIATQHLRAGRLGTVAIPDLVEGANIPSVGSIGIAFLCATPRPSRIGIPRARQLSPNSAHTAHELSTPDGCS